MTEWDPVIATKIIADLLQASQFGQETDMTFDEAEEIAKSIVNRLEQGQ